MKKILMFAMLVMVFGGVHFASAETAFTTGANTQAQIDAIKNLTEQIKALQTERKTLVSTLVTQLKQGSKGDAVTTLQSLLALDPSIYPEGRVTGFFGPLTAKAVRKFQEKNGLEQVGNVGPKTLEKLKKLADDNSLTVEEDDDSTVGNQGGEGHGKGMMRKLCAIVPPGHMIAQGWLKKNDGKAPVIPACQTLPKGIRDGLNKLDDDGEDEDNDGSGSPVADTTAPTVSKLVAEDVKSTEAKISWKTNEDAKGKLWYGIVDPTVTTGSPSKEESSFDDSHEFELSGLTAGTMYYYVVWSTDKAGNVTKSAQASFKTLAL
jgi:peptidoglycan hydrolase-like protein with peptidoglycan-binding domain